MWLRSVPRLVFVAALAGALAMACVLLLIALRTPNFDYEARHAAVAEWSIFETPPLGGELIEASDAYSCTDPYSGDDPETYRRWLVDSTFTHEEVTLDFVNRAVRSGFVVRWEESRPETLLVEKPGSREGIAEGVGFFWETPHVILVYTYVQTYPHQPCKMSP